jgi:predicted unusual protein kinase regulating ubiquinone biosynthesis (AarF/ABC1/UbiB family)
MAAYTPGFVMSHRHKPEDFSGRPHLHKLKTRPLDRNLAMAKVGLLAGTQIAGHELLNLFRSAESRTEKDRAFYTRQAQFLARELGQLKGSIMKVGQMLSLYGQYFMPEEAVDVLRGLQDDTPHVDWKIMRPALEKRLGRARLAELEIEPEPLAAASLGQVHITFRKQDRRKLCLKIQYPGLTEAIDSDIRTLSRLVTAARLAPRNVNLSPIMEEVRDMLHHEVDYPAELNTTAWYRRQLADDPRFVVPEVFPEYSSEQVLATSYEAGEHVQADAVQNLSQVRRNRLAHAALELFFREFFLWGRVQTDPHFGNYRIRIDPTGENDQIVLLDFGATRQFKPDFLRAYRRVIQGAFDRDAGEVFAGGLQIGLLRESFPAHLRQAFAEVCFLIIEPFSAITKDYPPRALLTDQGAYRWGDSDLPTRVTGNIGRASLSRHFRVPPREIVFLHRRLGGLFVLLAVLGAELQGRELLGQFLAGQEPDQG